MSSVTLSTPPTSSTPILPAQPLTTEQTKQPPTCSLVLSRAGFTPHMFFVGTFGLFLAIIILWPLKVQSLDTLHTCTLDPAHSYYNITDDGYQIRQSNTQCLSCGGRQTCLYLQEQQMMGECCSEPCINAQQQQVASLQTVIHAYTWTQYMACPIPSVRQEPYYIQRSCPYDDQNCQQQTQDYLLSYPKVTVCRLDRTSGPSQTCDTDVKVLILFTVFDVVGCGCSALLYWSTKRRLQKDPTYNDPNKPDGVYDD